MAVRRFLAPGGIDHFGAVPLPLLSTPLRSTGLEVGLLNPARRFGGALSALPVGSRVKPQPPAILLHFKDLETLLMTSKMCIVLCT